MERQSEDNLFQVHTLNYPLKGLAYQMLALLTLIFCSSVSDAMHIQNQGAKPEFYFDQVHIIQQKIIKIII